MAYNFLQAASNFSLSSAQANIGSGNFGSALTAGSMIWVVVVYYAAVQRTITLADTLGQSSAGGAYQRIAGGSIFNSTDQSGLESWYLLNTAAGDGTDAITATFSAAVDFPTIYASEYSGILTTGALVGQQVNRQVDPGGGANAITSGGTGVLGGQPALQVGLSCGLNTETPITAGSGFTTRGTIWNNFGAVEDARLTNTASVAATFTNGSAASDTWRTTTAVFLESVPGGGGMLVGQDNRRQMGALLQL